MCAWHPRTSKDLPAVLGRLIRSAGGIASSDTWHQSMSLGDKLKWIQIVTKYPRAFLSAERPHDIAARFALSPFVPFQAVRQNYPKCLVLPLSQMFLAMLRHFVGVSDFRVRMEHFFFAHFFNSGFECSDPRLVWYINRCLLLKWNVRDLESEQFAHQAQKRLYIAGHLHGHHAHSIIYGLQKKIKMFANMVEPKPNIVLSRSQSYLVISLLGCFVEHGISALSKSLLNRNFVHHCLVLVDVAGQTLEIPDFVDVVCALFVSLGNNRLLVPYVLMSPKRDYVFRMMLEKMTQKKITKPSCNS